jgi:geranylgeranyl reductase family protein
MDGTRFEGSEGVVPIQTPLFLSAWSDGRVTDIWDVIIVGAGPAGSAAAAAIITHAPDTRLLLLDRSEFPRDKACGDGIAHEVGGVLAGLGFDTDAIFDGMKPISRLRLRSPAGVEVDRVLPDRVHVVPREIFDDRLLTDVRNRGVELRRHEVRRLEIRANSVVLDDILTARVVIGADGAESAVRRAGGIAPTRPDRVALAIRGYAPELPGQADTQVITMTGEHWPAYAWSFPLGNGLANVGYGQLLGDRPLTRAQMLARLDDLLPGVEPQRLRAHKLPLSSGRPRIADGRVLLVGDAQSLINPLTGEGIYYAVTSGALAGQAAVTAGSDAGQEYRRLTTDRLGWHFRHTSTLARLGRWPSLIDAGMRAAKADQSAFDDLVRFGLAEGLLTPRLLKGLRFR